MRVIDENGKPLGVVETKKAIFLAKDKNMDLVLVAEKANPPVAKILDYGKYKYEQEKLLKKQKGKQKTIQLKEVRLTANISKHDLEVRIKRARDFLENGHKVKISLRIFGRNLQFADDKKIILEQVCQELKHISEIEQNISREKNSFQCYLKPKK